MPAVDGITPETARQLSRAAKQARSFTQRRDEYVVKARAEGGSLREIAGLAGLTHRAIAKILERMYTRRRPPETASEQF